MMILIACVDDRMGMMFHHRRVSQDKAVYEDILNMCQKRNLYMEKYSYKLFLDFATVIIHVADNMRGIQPDEYFFAENPITIDENIIEKIVLYHWNRRYPADQYFPINLEKWSLVGREDFIGKSHEKITKEIWEK
ncbi:MAG: ribonuclease Z [Lachnospiraceae bacterium]|nr:ribonuclease Z [Lachnospiraceae bacterium]